MATGRPPSGLPPTRMIRVREDIADMLGMVAELKGETVAELADPLIRPGVTQLYAQVAKQAEAIKRAREKARKELADVFANDLGDPGA